MRFPTFKFWHIKQILKFLTQKVLQNQLLSCFIPVFRIFSFSINRKNFEFFNFFFYKPSFHSLELNVANSSEYQGTLKSLYNMFFILCLKIETNWVAAFVPSFPEEWYKMYVFFRYFVFTLMIEGNWGAGCLFVLFQKDDKNIWSLFKKCFIFCLYSKTKTNQVVVSICSFPKELLKFLTLAIPGRGLFTIFICTVFYY